MAIWRQGRMVHNLWIFVRSRDLGYNYSLFIITLLVGIFKRLFEMLDELIHDHASVLNAFEAGKQVFIFDVKAIPYSHQNAYHCRLFVCFWRSELWIQCR